MSNAMQIAETIRQQIGAGRFAAMTGARDFMALKSGLQFRLPSNFARDGINLVQISLEPSDTYSMRFMKLRGVKLTECGTVSDVYADRLQAEFTARTGLDTRM